MSQALQQPAIEVSPRRALIDADIELRLAGLAPRSLVTLRAEARPSPDTTWRSHVDLVTDSAGGVDLATAVPLDGTYRIADVGGLLWSLALGEDSATRIRDARFVESGLEPFDVVLTAEVDGEVVATATITRVPVAEGMTRTEIREGGVVGTLFVPPGEGPHPVVVVVPGSNGGVPEPFAALYASHGVAALALGYFRFGDLLPPTLEEIPLEYFESAFAWIAAHPELDERRLVLSGASRGGELVLLLGSRFPQVSAVIAWVPSGLVNRGFAAIGATEQKAAWTWRGQPLPYVQTFSEPGEPLPTRDGGAIHALRALNALSRAGDLSGVEIPVERIGGPVLLISGRDDLLWPAAVYGDWIVERLEREGFGHAVEHLSYERAGHTLGPANAPATVIVGPDAGQVTAAFTHLGGDPEGIARARADLWPRVLAFLDEATAA